MKKSPALLVLLASTMLLSGCGGMNERLAAVGRPPAFSNIENPYEDPNYHPISMPMPPKEAENTSANSLWQAGSRAFFKDQRANKVGDILTVLVTITDKADMQNKTERTRDGSESTGIPNVLGFETKLGKILPDAVDPANLVSVDSSSSSTGDGKISRKEDVNLKLAAVVTQVLPNGNFILRGTQEVRINSELRQLTLTGIIRPEDILNNNSVSYEKIAEARIAYGGKGTISDLQQPRYGQQVIDAILPF
jgi:flagellar L-ring protein FlgH